MSLRTLRAVIAPPALGDPSREIKIKNRRLTSISGGGMDYVLQDHIDCAHYDNWAIEPVEFVLEKLLHACA